MSAPDLNNLRQVLDEFEAYVGTLGEEGPKAAIAGELRAVIREARGLLHPSADSTANFVDTRQIVERLNALRMRAEQSP
jgi:hypothetical protein